MADLDPGATWRATRGVVGVIPRYPALGRQAPWNPFPMITRLLLGSGLLWSAVVSGATWPGPAPCNTTLQACIEATAAGDTVNVASSAVIDESLFINKPLAL